MYIYFSIGERREPACLWSMGGNQPIITLQSFKNVLPKPSVLFSLRAHTQTPSPPLTRPSTAILLPNLTASTFSTLHWTGCLPITIRDSPDTCAFGFRGVQMRLWRKTKLHRVLVFPKGPTFFFSFSFSSKKPILPPVGLLYGKGTHSTLQSLLQFWLRGSLSRAHRLLLRTASCCRIWRSTAGTLPFSPRESERKKSTIQMNWNIIVGVGRGQGKGRGGRDHNHNTYVSEYLYMTSTCFYQRCRIQTRRRTRFLS